MPEPMDLGHLEKLVAVCLDADDVGAAVDRACREHPALATMIRRAVHELDAAHMLGGPAEPAADAPRRIGGFTLHERLGAGGMEVVYRATEDELQREVALKILRPELTYFEGSRTRFRREVEAAVRLHHPGIVQVYGVGEHDGAPFFTMELVRGCSLAELFRELRDREAARLTGGDLCRVIETRLQIPEGCTRTGTHVRRLGELSWVDACLDLATQVGEALQHAHERGVLHRDVKPSNIILDGAGRARLLDFGLARVEAAQQLTQSRSQLGSLPYMSPEQLSGTSEVGPATDVYGLGVTLYEALTLTNPFLGPDAVETRRRVEDAAVPPIRKLNRAVPWDVATVCMTAMEPDLARRYRTVVDFGDDLENLRGRRPIAARRPGITLRLRRFLQRHPAAVLTGLVAMLVLLAGASIFAVYAQNASRRYQTLATYARGRATRRVCTGRA